MKPRTIALLLPAMLSLAIPARSQPARAGGAPPTAQLAEPQTIFAHAAEIGLSPGQGARLQEITREAGRKIAPKQQALQAANAALSSELAGTPIDAARALESFDSLLELERSMKREHLKMLVAINNVLEPGQREKLRALAAPRASDLGAGVLPAVDPEALRQEVDAMRVEEVAWRKIGWETCLLDGIRASREQGKPIALWVFIDRPVDDKRC